MQQSCNKWSIHLNEETTSRQSCWNSRVRKTYAIKILELSAMRKETTKLSRRDTELKKNVYFAIFILLEKNN